MSDKFKAPERSKAFNCPSPVVLSSLCAVAAGNNASPNMSELSYPYRKAVLIDEIRFDMWTNNALSFNLGSIVYAKFSLGQNYLMRDPVPVWLLGTTMDQLEEESSDTYLATVQAVSHYRWRLPEPLYLAPGQTLRPVFSRPATTLTVPAGDVNVQVSYAGRVVPPNAPVPGVLALPYAAPFVTTLGIAGGYQQSNEYHLFNATGGPLKIQRLTGRVLFNTGSTQGTSFASLTPNGVANQNNTITIQMFDSWGGKMVNDLTGPGDVFDWLRAGWTVDTVMPAKGQYDVRAWNLPAAQQLHIGMVGVREVPL